MNKIIEEVGKVCLTAEGYWDREKEYEELSVVTDKETKASYLSRKPVPALIDISNTEYWQSIASHTARNGSFIVLSDKDFSTGELLLHTLESAINSIAPEDRNPGTIIGFYGIDYSVDEEYKTWFLYQFDAEDVCYWEDVQKWTSLYNNVNKFRGFYKTEEELINIAIRPTVGDYANVGENMEHAVLYMCIENGKWTNTQTPAYAFANLYEAICSKDFDELEYTIDEQYSDRAEKDALGRIIHFTYVTREGLSAFVLEKMQQAINEINLPDGSIYLQHLSQSLIDYIGSGGAITNYPDEEDLTTILSDNGTRKLKFKDKKYTPTNFSGKGRVYLRKNMADGINVLEQHLLTEPNTIYIIQYDYCMNDAIINIPENSIIKFEGGSINGGTLVLNNTEIRGVINESEIGINLTIEGTYKTGQQFFDTETQSAKWWTGEVWSYAMDDILRDKLDELPTESELNEMFYQKADAESVDISIEAINRRLEILEQAILNN